MNDAPLKMKLYISGAITGLEFPTIALIFQQAESTLFMAGYFPVNPLRVEACPDMTCLYRPHRPYGKEEGKHTHGCYLRHDIQAMLDCDGVATLEGWEASDGALLEVYVAHKCDLPVQPLSQWLPRNG